MTSLTRYLLSHGHTVHVFKLGDDYYGNQISAKEAVLQQICSDFTVCDGSNLKRMRYSRRHLKDLLLAATDLEKFDCCVMSCGPYYIIPAVYAVCLKRKIPLIVDYRDLWLYDPRPAERLITWFLQKATKLLYTRTERNLMKMCAAFVSVTPHSVSHMIQIYPFLKDKSLCIYNGYEKVSLPRLCENAHQTIDICFLGKFSYYSDHMTGIFLGGIHSLLEKDFPIRLIHIGEAEEKLSALLAQYQIPTEVVAETGQLPYEQALAIASNADIFAAIINYSEGLGTKIFDYIYLNRPIVGIAPPNSEFEELLHDAENAFVCQRAEQVTEAVQKIVSEKCKYLTKSSAYRDQFSREQQNQRYEELLTHVVEQKKACH